MAKLAVVDAPISDVVMPRIKGIEAALMISEMHRNRRIILISGQATTPDLLADAAQRSQALEILAKPVHPTEILDRLRTAITL